MERLGPVRKKASTDLSFSYHGKFHSDEEEPTQENKRVIDLKDPIDAISLNKAENRAVVAGLRGILQIISVTGDENSVTDGPFIVRDVDLRNKKKSSLYNAAKNVKWNKNDDDLIAATSSAGAITVWSASRRSHSILKAHERSATCVDWNHEEKDVLISGSKDCHVYMIDIRDPGKKTDFIDGTSEAIHDLAFVNHPGACHLFFTGDDSGALKLWDRRNPSKFVFQRTAHNSFVSTISINPLDKYWLATGGGRDKVVKVWDWRNGRIERKYIIETMAPLGKCAWRPNHKYQLATCASVNDTNVHIWDIRRPFIPLATYEEHTDSVTDACWPFASTSESNLFLSCGKDNLVVLHTSDSGHAPISYACDVPFDITPDGVLGIACNTKIQEKITEMEQLPNAARTSITNRALYPRFRKKTASQKHEAFSQPVKSIMTFGIPDTMRISLPPNAFYELALKYVLGGKKLSRICTINARAAKACGKDHVAQTWRLVEALIAQAKLQEIYDEDARLSDIETERQWDVRKRELAREGNRLLPNVNELNVDNMKRIFADKLESKLLINEFINMSDEHSEDSSPDSYNSNSESDENREKKKLEEYDSENDLDEKRKKKRKKRHRNMSTSEFYFGGAESNFHHEQEKKENLHLNEFMGLRDEAYELRTIFKDQKYFCDANKPGDEEGESGWSPMLEVMRLLRYHSEQGDMQTCASVAIVCGRMLFDVVDTYTVGAWIDCYMEMCSRLELFVTIARIKKHASIYRINAMSLEGTAVEIIHTECLKPVINGRCLRCEKAAAPECTMCRQPITGLVFECRICRHSMHPEHATNWFDENETCCAIDCLCDCSDSHYPKDVRYFIQPEDLQLKVELRPKPESKATQKLRKLGLNPPVKEPDHEKLPEDDGEDSDDDIEAYLPYIPENVEPMIGNEYVEYIIDPNNKGRRHRKISTTKLIYPDNSQILEMEPAHKSMIRELEEAGGGRKKDWGEGPVLSFKNKIKIDQWKREKAEKAEKKRLMKEAAEQYVEEVKTESEWESETVEESSETSSSSDSSNNSFAEKRRENDALLDTMDSILDQLVEESEKVDIKVIPTEEEFGPKSYESECTVMTTNRNTESAMPSLRTTSPTLTASPFAYNHIFGSEISDETDLTSTCLKQEASIEIVEEKEEKTAEDKEVEEYERETDIHQRLLGLLNEGNRRIGMRGPDPYAVYDSEIEDESKDSNEEDEDEEEEEEWEDSDEEEKEEEEEEYWDEGEEGLELVEEEMEGEQEQEQYDEEEEEKEERLKDIVEESYEEAPEDASEEGVEEATEVEIPVNEEDPEVEVPIEVPSEVEGEDEFEEKEEEDEYDDEEEDDEEEVIVEEPCGCEIRLANMDMENRDVVMTTDLSEYPLSQIKDFKTILDRNNPLAYHQFNQIEKDKVHNEKFMLVHVEDIDTECFNLQLTLLQSSPNIQEKTSRDSKIFAEFVQVFYFVPWKNIMHDELVLRKLYEMCEQYKNARKRTCRTHFWDFLFRFFTASLAAKIRFDYSQMIGIPAEDLAENIDWTSLKSCLKSFEDFEEEELDEIIGSNKSEESDSWMIYETQFAEKYWDIFGKVPIEIKNRRIEDEVEENENAINSLEIGTRRKSKFRTKKAKRRIRRMTKELFGINVESKNKKMIEKFNEKHPNRIENFMRYNDGQNWEKSDIYQTTSEIFYRPADTFYPICEFEDNGNIITIYPKVPKFLQILKLRLRHKFSGKYLDHLKIDSTQYQTTDLLKMSRFKRFRKSINLEPSRSKKLGRINEENDELLYWYMALDKVDGPLEAIDEEILYEEHKVERKLREWERQRSEKRMKAERKKCEIGSVWRMKWFPKLERNVKEAREAMCKAKALVDRDIRLWLEYEYLLSQKRRNLAIQRRVERKRRRKANQFGIDRNAPIVDTNLIEFLPVDGRNIIETEEEEEDVKENEEANWQNHAYQQGCLSIIDIERDYDFDNEKHFYEARTKPEIEEVDTNTTTSQGTCPTSPSDAESIESWYNDNIVENMESEDYATEQKIIKMRLYGAAKPCLDPKSERIELYQELKQYLTITGEEKNSEVKKSQEIYEFIRRMHEQELRRVANKQFRELHMKRLEQKIEPDMRILTENVYEKMIEPLEHFEKMFSKYGRYYLAYCGDEIGEKQFLKSTFGWFLRRFGENMEMDKDLMRKLMKLWRKHGRGQLDEFYELICEHRMNTCDYNLGFKPDRVKALGSDVVNFIEDEYNDIQVAEVLNDIVGEVCQFEMEKKQLASEVYIEHRWLRYLFKNVIMRMDMNQFFQWKWVAYYEQLALFFYDTENFKKKSVEIAKRDRKTERLVAKVLHKRHHEIEQSSEEEDIVELDEKGRPKISVLDMLIDGWIKRDYDKKRRRYNEDVHDIYEFRRLMLLIFVHIDKIDPQFEKILEEFLNKYPNCIELMYNACCVTGHYEEREFEELKKYMNEFGRRKGCKKEDRFEAMSNSSECSDVPSHVSGNELDSFTDIIEKFGMKRSKIDTKYVHLEYCEDQVNRFALERYYWRKTRWSEAAIGDGGMVSYNSLENVTQHELYFTREEAEYRIPRLIIVFEPESFLDDEHKFEQVIDTCTSPYNFCRLVQVQRLITNVKNHFREEMLKKYGSAKNMSNCMISVFIDSKARPWFYLIQSKNPESEKLYEKCGNVKEMKRFRMLNDSEIFVQDLIEYMKIDEKVLECCAIVRSENAEENILDIFDMDFEDLTKDEGVLALETIMRMKTPSPKRMPLMEEIFKPIYDTWYPDWKIWAQQQTNSDVIYPPADNSEAIAQNQVKLAINYAYQYYRMIKYDPVLSKTKCKDFSIRFPTFRQDVPSSSLLSNLRELIVNFLQDTTLNVPNRDGINRQILEIAEHGNPNPRIMYSREKSEKQLNERLLEDRIGSNEDLHSVITTNATNTSPESDCSDEILWLRSKFEMKDMFRRRFTAQISFEIAKMTMATVSPKLANLKIAERKFEELMKSMHARQRPLLDMMLTRFTDIDKMTDEQRDFLYEHKLINDEDIHRYAVEPPTRKNSELSDIISSDIESQVDRNSVAEPERAESTQPTNNIEVRKMPRLPEPFSSEDEVEDKGQEGEEEEEEDEDSDVEEIEAANKEVEKITAKLRKISERSEDISADDDFEMEDDEKPETVEENQTEKMILGKFLWERREKLRKEYHDIAMRDRSVVLEKLPRKLKHTIDRITKTIRENCDKAHPSWGPLRQIVRWDDASDPDGPTEEEIRKHGGRVPRRMYIAPRVYDATNPAQNGSRWF